MALLLVTDKEAAEIKRSRFRVSVMVVLCSWLLVLFAAPKGPLR